MTAFTDDAYKLVDRLKEPSTYSALAAAMVALGISVPPQWGAWAATAAGVAAVIAALLPERPKN